MIVYAIIVFSQLHKFSSIIYLTYYNYCSCHFIQSNYAQVDHSGIAPFAPLPIPPTIYSDIDHVRTGMKRGGETPPVIPPKVGGGFNADEQTIDLR